MSIFIKQLSQVTFADLKELLQEAAVENVRLEFKSKIPNKDDTLKKLSSFANSFGGLMIIGATEKDGRLQDLPGVDEESGYKQKVVQWCFDAISPLLMVEVSDAIPVPAPSVASAALAPAILGTMSALPISAAMSASAVPVPKVCYVVSTVESDVAPHFVNGRKGIWVRSDEFSQRYEPQLADENEILHLLNRRRLIQERRDELVRRSESRFRKLLSRQPQDVGLHQSAAHLELSLGPRFPARPVCEQAKVADLLQKRRVDWRDGWFPHTNSAFVSQHESVLLLTPRDVRNTVALVEANIWGLLFYGSELDIEIGPKQTLGLHEIPTTGIHLYRLVGHLLVSFEHSKRIHSMNPSGG